MMLGLPEETRAVGHRQGIPSLSRAKITHVHSKYKTGSRHYSPRWLVEHDMSLC